MEVYFEAKSASDADTNCKGTIKFHEYNQDDDEIVTEITCEQESEFRNQVKKILNNEMSELTMKCLQSLSSAMKNKDADEIKLKRD
jgi:hypothetical protein